MAYNKTKRYRNNRGKNKSSHKKSTIHKKRRNSRKRSSNTRKGGNPPISDAEKFYDIRGEVAAMIATITSIEKLDMLEEKMKTQPVVYNIFKELIDVHREALEK